MGPGPMPLPNLTNAGAGTSGSFTRTTYRSEVNGGPSTSSHYSTSHYGGTPAYEERVTRERHVPVGASVSMSEINQMAGQMGVDFQQQRMNEKNRNANSEYKTSRLHTKGKGVGTSQ